MTPIFTEQVGHALRSLTFEPGDYVFACDGYCRLIFGGAKTVRVFVDGSDKIQLDGKTVVEMIGEQDTPQTVYALRILDEVQPPETNKGNREYAEAYERAQAKVAEIEGSLGILDGDIGKALAAFAPHREV